jgi:hypothetical protein
MSVPTFVDRCRVVSMTDPYGRILGFLDRSHYYFFQVAPQLYSRGWVDSVPDPLLLRKSGIAGNRTRDLWICSKELWPLQHRVGRSGTIVGLILYRIDHLISSHLFVIFSSSPVEVAAYLDSAVLSFLKTLYAKVRIKPLYTRALSRATHSLRSYRPAGVSFK